MRLFIAIDLPEEIKAGALPLLEDLPGGKAVPPEQLHLTLRFLGEVPEPLFEEIKSKLKQVRQSPFELSLKGVGCFPNQKRARVLWVGIETPPALIQLKNQVEEVVSELGFERDNKPFRPHLTMARLKYPKPKAVSDFLQKNFSFQSAPFTVKNYHLYSSKLSPKGALHTREQSFELQ